MFKERRPSGLDEDGLNDYSHLLESQRNISGCFTGSRLSNGTADLDGLDEVGERGRGLGLLEFDSKGAAGAARWSLLVIHLVGYCRKRPTEKGTKANL